MLIAYISGSYRAREWNSFLTVIFYPFWIIYKWIQIAINIHRARVVAIKYWRAGYAVITPHSNTAFMDGSCSDKTWLEGDLEMVKRSDVIVMMEKWKKSEGAKSEFETAVKFKKEIIFEGV